MTKRQRASVVCVHDNALLVVFLAEPSDPPSNTEVGRIRPYLPGGAIEAGETPPAAAQREALEETGFQVKVDLASEYIATYPFQWGLELFDCTTHFFTAQLLSNEARAVDDGPSNKGYGWLPLTAVPEVMGYHPTILSAILKLLPQN